MLPYTLLADDNTSLSIVEQYRKYLRAHLIQSLALYGKIVISDNQIIASKNLRLLIRTDLTIMRLIAEGRIKVAIRDAHRGQENEMRQIFDAFLSEGKIPDGFQDYNESSEFIGIERNATKIYWPYDAIRDFFSTNSKAMVMQQFSKLLTSSQFELLAEIISEEEERDGHGIHPGLGRAFFTNLDRLPTQIERLGFRSAAENRMDLLNWTNAIYLSNLPRYLNFSPIYHEDHQDSFQLLRSASYRFETIAEHAAEDRLLDASHYIEGLNQLKFDDLNKIWDSQEFKQFEKCIGTVNEIADTELLMQYFEQITLRIERTILSSYHQLGIATTEPSKRKFVRGIAMGIGTYGGVIFDLIQLAEKALSPTSTSSVIPPGLGSILGVIVDIATKTALNEPDTADPAIWATSQRKLERYLQEQGAEDKIHNRTFKKTSSFRNEVVISNISRSP